VIFFWILAHKVHFAQPGKFIYDNICQSAAQNRLKKGTRKWFQRCSGGKACSESTHLLQRHNRVFIDRLMCYFTLRFTSVTGINSISLVWCTIISRISSLTKSLKQSSSDALKFTGTIRPGLVTKFCTDLRTDWRPIGLEDQKHPFLPFILLWASGATGVSVIVRTRTWWSLSCCTLNCRSTSTRLRIRNSFIHSTRYCHRSVQWCHYCNFNFRRAWMCCWTIAVDIITQCFQRASTLSRP